MIEGPTDEGLRTIVTFAQRQIELEDELAEAERYVKETKVKLRQVSEVDLPAALEEAGLSELTLLNGAKVTLTLDVRPHPLAENMPKICEWLTEHGHGDLIKHDITVSFRRDQGDTARRFLEWAAKAMPKQKVNDKTYVHSSTLWGFVNEKVVKYEDLPSEFGVTPLQITKIKREGKADV